MIGEMRTEMQRMTSRLHELVESVQFCSQRVTDFEATVKRFQDQLKIIDKLNAENMSLRKQVDDLSGRVGDLEQYSRRNNLELQGVPEKDNEDLLMVLKTMGDFIGVPVSSTDVDAAHRVPHGPGNQNQNRGTNPKGIVVRFCSRLTRDNFLAAAKLKKRSGPPGSPPGLSIDGVSECCFINEHLTPANKFLLSNVRKAAREKGYKFVWTRDCRVYVRKNETARPILSN
nr:uncharacterized protein LOC111422435 [Onthophagus taurus]